MTEPLFGRIGVIVADILAPILDRPEIIRIRHWIKNRLRPSKTLVLVTSTHWYRLDMGAPPGARSFMDGPRGALSAKALGQVLPQILGTGPRPARRVWLLFTGFKVYNLSISTAQTLGLEGALLRQAILHELEEGHGLSLTRMDVGWTLVNESDGLADYFIVMGPKGIFEAMHQVTRESGCRLEGMSHPGPMPGLLMGLDESIDEVLDEEAEPDDFLLAMEDDPVDDIGWHRLEYWPDMVLGIRGSGERIVEVSCLPPENGNLERWLSQQSSGEYGEVLRADNQPLLERLPGHLDLEVKADVEIFLRQWAESLTHRQQARVAWLAPTISPEAEMRLSVGMAAGVTLLCLVHAGYQGWVRSELKAEREELQAQHQEIESLKERNDTERREIEQLKKTVEGLKAQDLPSVLEKLRTRSTRLMNLLAQHVGDDVVVESIHFEGNTLTITGVALRISVANRLFLVLAHELAGFGFRIYPPEKIEMNLLEGGGPWEYAIRMDDTGLAGFGEVAKRP